LSAVRPDFEVLAERIAREFEACARSRAPDIPVRIDYGIAVFTGEGHDVASLLAAADRGLYTNKQKAHDRSASLTVPPQVTAQQTEGPVPRIEVAEDHRKVYCPLSLAARGASQKLGKIGLQPADSTLTIARNTTYTTGC
jgi:hypothetical protein